MPTSILDGEIKEHIQGRKTPLRDKGTVAKRLVVEPLCLPRNETKQIYRRGRFHPGCGVGAVSLGWDGLLECHNSH